MKLPGEIQDFLSRNNELELALIGCRADNPHNSYDCCEYDIAILGANTKNSFDKKIIKPRNLKYKAKLRARRVKEIEPILVAAPVA